MYLAARVSLIFFGNAFTCHPSVTKKSSRYRLCPMTYVLQYVDMMLGHLNIQNEKNLKSCNHILIFFLLMVTIFEVYYQYIFEIILFIFYHVLLCLMINYKYFNNIKICIFECCIIQLNLYYNAYNECSHYNIIVYNVSLQGGNIKIQKSLGKQYP